MTIESLLRWHNLIFLLPLGTSLLLLLLFSLNTISGGGEESDTAEESGDADGGDAQEEGEGGAEEGESDESETGGKPTENFLPALIGVGRAPLSLIANAFVLTWGIAGFAGNELLVHSEQPSFLQILPSLGMGFVGGLLGARTTAEIAGRLLPKTETKAVSRNSLFGLTGRVLFTVTETAGRIRVYDEHRTLHDERCRVLPGRSGIEKGRYARIVDMDAEGRLLVEEVHDKL